MKKASIFLLFAMLFALLGIAPASAKPGAQAKSKRHAEPAPAARKAARKATAPAARRAVRSAHRTKAGSRPRASLRKRQAIPRVQVRPSAGDLAGLDRSDDPLGLRSNVALVLDEASSAVLFEKNAGAVLPIASLTKLMTALVVLEAGQDMDEILTVTDADVDRIKHTSSRLPIGARLTRAEMLHISLMSSENRAASALGRHYPGGLDAFVEAMNAHARLLGMTNTRYVEPTGLSSRNVSSARDLARLVAAAEQHPLIRSYSTASEHAVDPGGPALHYRNSNRLIHGSDWEIVLQKTGYISEAGRCLVMKAMIEGRAVIMVFLDAKGKFSRAADANRIRDWLEKVKLPALTSVQWQAQQ